MSQENVEIVRPPGRPTPITASKVLRVLREDGNIEDFPDTEVWNRFFHVWTFGDGKIVRSRCTPTASGPSKAAGLRE